jgi:chemotaxis protein CheD
VINPGRSQREAPLPQPRVIRGFEDINRYWDRQNHVWAAKILPGEYYVTTSEELIVTVLGSCISACVRDPIFGVGGMNHFMLPSSSAAERYGSMQLSDAARYGNYAMEHLINDILKQGARRENLELKLFGGGKVMAKLSDVGLRNIEFVQEYVHTEGLNVVAEDLGDIYPRKILYNPITGKVRMKKLRSMHNNTVFERETRYMQQLKQEPVAGEVELF